MTIRPPSAVKRGEKTPYPEAFGLTENPFRITASERFTYLTRGTKEAISHVRHVIDSRRGLGVVSGPRLHDLRHSYATFMLAAGVDLKSISTSLGHSTIAVTANTYAHVSDSLQQQNADRLDVALRSVVGDALTGPFETSVPQRCHTTAKTSKNPRKYEGFLVAPPDSNLSLRISRSRLE